MYPYHNQGRNQFWMLFKIDEVREDEGCLDYAGQSSVLCSCHNKSKRQANLDAV